MKNKGKTPQKKETAEANIAVGTMHLSGMAMPFGDAAATATVLNIYLRFPKKYFINITSKKTKTK